MTSSKARAVAVYACHSDVTNYKVLELAAMTGIIDKECALNVELLSNEGISKVLEELFGFTNGDYEEEVIEGIQRSRFGNAVVNEVRYMGTERTDKLWLANRMASSEVKELVKFGDELRL